MYNLSCLNCGFIIEVDDKTESCECEACGATCSVADLLAHQQKVKAVVEKVAQEFESRTREERERKKAEEERKKADEERQKQTEAYIARRQADAEVERAKSAGKPQTVIVNGPNVPEIANNAVSAFAAKDFTTALKGAKEVLSNNADNIPAGFIAAFNEEVFNKRMHQLDGFFQKVPKLPGSVSAEDMEQLCQLFISGRLKLAGYETQILELVYTNAQEMGPAAVCKFVDAFSPNIIASRTNGSFLAGGLAEVYTQLAAFCSIPKTCFTLLGAIESNPESPLKTGAFYMTGKSKKFYEDLVAPVGKIIDSMRSEKNRPQFQKAYADKVKVYRQKTGI